MSKIKVVFFIDSYRIGGMHRQVLILLQNINKDIFEPIVIVSSSDGGLFEDYVKTKCKLIGLNWKNTYDLLIIYRLSKVLKDIRPDIIFIPLAVNFLYYRLSRLFWKETTIQVGSFRAFGFWKSNKGKLYQKADDFLSKWLYNTSKIVTTNSHALKNHYEPIVNHDITNPIKVIYNGNNFNFLITQSKKNVREELDLQQNQLMIVMVARLDPWKDFETVLEAIKIVQKKNNNFVLYFIGDGILRNEIESKIKNFGLNDRVKLLGEIRNVYDYINSCDISILSSFGEGFSNSILESMAMGKPVIATNVGGNPEALGEDEVAGVLIPKRSPKVFAGKLITLINDEKIRAEMGSAAKKRIEKLCNIEKYVKSYEDIFINCKKDKV